MTGARAGVRLTAGAEHDLLGIYRRRLAQRGADGTDGAEALLDRLVADIEGLADYPERGPVPPELEALGIREYRQLSLAPYRTIYLPAGENVTVMLVADSRRDFRTLLEERLLRGGGWGYPATTVGTAPCGAPDILRCTASGDGEHDMSGW